MRRWFFSLSLALLASLASASAVANRVALKPYSATYDLYKGGMHLAVSELSLERSDADWRWVLETRARGIYKLFTKKRPYAETRFTRLGDSFQLTEILLSEHGSEHLEETARFDWDSNRLEVLRKSKRSEISLGDEVYDYQTIHLLAASMGQAQLDKPTISFYRKGKLVKSHFVYSGQQTVKIGEQSLDANVYEQVVGKSNSKIKYYYDAQNPLLPLRIERLEAGESPTVLSLREVRWGL